MSKQVMQRALDALEGADAIDTDMAAAIAELRAEIAKPVEPVGQVNEISDDGFYVVFTENLAPGTKLYAAPPDTEAMRNNLRNAVNILQSFMNGGTSIEAAQAYVNALNAFIDKQGGGV